MHSDASNASGNRDETRMVRPEKRGTPDRVTAMHNALDLPQERGGSEKNAPLILHQRPTKKAAKNGTLPDRATRSDTPMQFRHCIGRSALTRTRATLAFFPRCIEANSRSATGSLHALSVTQKQAAAGWIMHDNRAGEPFAFADHFLTILRVHLNRMHSRLF